MLDTLPADTIYATVTAAAYPVGADPLFNVGDVIALPFVSHSPHIWGFTYSLGPLIPGGGVMTFGFLCDAIGPPLQWPSIFTAAYIPAVPDVFFDQMNGTHYLGDAARWMEGVRTFAECIYDVRPTGMCDRCGISVWTNLSELDPLGYLTNGAASQPITVQISGVNPRLPDPFHTFAPWFWPEDFFPPYYL